jgi:hypothetical protein
MENYNGNKCNAGKELKIARKKKTELSAIIFYNASFLR